MIRSWSEVNPAVRSVMAQTHDPRLREIMTALVEHLHGFVAETRLTETEFQQATKILNTMGRQSNDPHNECELMAGSLGVSAPACLLNDGATETTQSLLGPFWRLNHPATENGVSLLRSETPGPRLHGRFAFRDGAGAPAEGPEVDIRHASPVGLYRNQDEAQTAYNLRGKFVTGPEGEVRFRSVRPIGHPIPTTTTVGRLLEAQGRHPYRPAHVLARKPGFKTLIFRIDVDETDHLTSDVQFGVAEALIGRLSRGEGPEPVEGGMEEWRSLDHTFVMPPGESRLPIPPIS